MRQIEERYISLLTDFGFKRIKMFNDKLSFKYVDIAKFTPTELKEYEDSLKAYRDVKNSIDTAMEKGREEGKNLKAIQIAKKMLEAGMDVDTVMKMTDLSKSEIEKL